MNINRRSFVSLAGLGLAGCVTASRTFSTEVGRTWVYDPHTGLHVTWPGLAQKLRVWVAGDTHFALRDSRDDAYADNYKRLVKWPATKPVWEKMLQKAKAAQIDLLVLVGDIMSFPSYANVDYIRQSLDASGLAWIYIAGNHDWHYEGVPGSDQAQRAQWIRARLAPLYRGENPLMYSKVVKGVRFVMIDNSIYHILPEQLAFYRAEAAKGEPVALCMHIPLWAPGWDIFTSGNPAWGAKTDPYWQIERRERWAERQSDETFAFREAVLNTPNLIGVFTGHQHNFMTASVRGQHFFSVARNQDGKYLDLHLAP